MTRLVALTDQRRDCLTRTHYRIFTTMSPTKFLSDDDALSSVTIVALLILATLLISIVLALFILS